MPTDNEASNRAYAKMVREQNARVRPAKKKRKKGRPSWAKGQDSANSNERRLLKDVE